MSADHHRLLCVSKILHALVPERATGVVARDWLSMHFFPHLAGSDLDRLNKGCLQEFPALEIIATHGARTTMLASYRWWQQPRVALV